MAKPKVPQPETDVSGKKMSTTPSKGSLPGPSGHVGQGDCCPPVVLSSGTPSRATYPLTAKTPNTVLRKPKGKFTITATQNRMPSKSQSIPDISGLKKTLPLLKYSRKSVATLRVGKKVTKPRKSVTMLELRRPSKPIGSELNYIQVLESLGKDTGDGFDDKYRYLAYKTYCFMMKNAWKRSKDERQVALERVAKLQTSVLKTKTQLHVIKSLYHIERRHFDAASVQLHESKQKLATLEGINRDLGQELETQIASVNNLTKSNEKLHRDLDDVIAKANRMEIQLDRKRDELSQAKNDNEFLIKQRQEMEASMTKRLNRYKDALKDTTEALVDANKELDHLQPMLEELEMKRLKLDEYRYINEIQVQEIDYLSHELQTLRESLKMKSRLKLVWKCMSQKKERNWYLGVMLRTFIPSLQSHDLVAVEASR